ncbi:MAG TPA: benzoyl-CoA oxygenase, partial [Rhodoblastus sp.]|nr:benzoyl-CoA oxygenase [Rhodoblastus sp.]
KHFAYSRVPGEKKVYVQDLMRVQHGELSRLLKSDKTHIYVCGLKGMEQGVDSALDDICRGAELKWREMRDAMRAEGRYHVETY